MYERKIGNYKHIKEHWSTFIAQNKHYHSGRSRLIEKFYVDPATTLNHNCICDLCCTVDQEIKTGNIMEISGGKFAILPFKGRIQDIFCMLQGFFSIWLTQSDYSMRAKYGLSIYQQIDWQHDYVEVDFYIPVK